MAATAASRQASRVMRSLRSRCRSDVAMKTWIRRRAAGCSAQPARSMSGGGARAGRPGGADVGGGAAREGADDRAADVRRDDAYRFSVRLGRDGETRLDD